MIDPAEPFLCRESADPDRAREPSRIDCALEQGRFAPPGPAPPSELRVMAYNLERGLRLDEQIDAFARGALPRPDVLFVSEADRGCGRTRGRNVARDLARALAMDYVFAVEFVELPRFGGAGGRLDRACEHGNAILSRYPLRDPRALPHATSHRWFEGPLSPWRAWGEPRLGRRTALHARLELGRGRTLDAYSLHLDDGVARDAARAAQVGEVLADARKRAGTVLIGGDLNLLPYAMGLALGRPVDPASAALAASGIVDAHAVLPLSRRPTCGPLVLDLILSNRDAFTGPEVCDVRRCGGLSDHAPVWASLRLD